MGKLSLVPEPHRPVRRDSLGRRIGENWWREYNTTLLWEARLDWERRRDEVCIGYTTEEREFAEHTPPPTLRDFLVRNAGMNTEPENEDQVA